MKECLCKSGIIQRRLRIVVFLASLNHGRLLGPSWWLTIGRLNLNFCKSKLLIQVGYMIGRGEGSTFGSFGCPVLFDIRRIHRLRSNKGISSEFKEFVIDLGETLHVLGGNKESLLLSFSNLALELLVEFTYLRWLWHRSFEMLLLVPELIEMSWNTIRIFFHLK